MILPLRTHSMTKRPPIFAMGWCRLRFALMHALRTSTCSSPLLNVLPDENHYKLALGQLHTARHLICQVAKDDVRLLKLGDLLY